jgi:beta-lactamase superfamily II metal-dependent hydrolase
MRLATLLLAGAGLLSAAKTLDIYFVDVEGGQATLIVTPSKEALLVDAGWAGFDARDALRIRAAMKAADVKKIDYLLVTHFHRDHAGGVLPLTERVQVLNFLDHGPNTEMTRDVKVIFEDYEEATKGKKRDTLKAGDRLPLKGVDAVVVSSNGETIGQALAGAAGANPLCGSAKKKEDDPTENARSVGFVLSFGRFRFVDFGDLTWNKELELACPQMKLPPVSVYLSTHHGMAVSGSPAMVQALRPRVAVVNNGGRKGGSAEALRVIKGSPGIEDVWQLHYAIPAEKEDNANDAFIANIDEGCQGKGIHISASEDGSFTVTNLRNKYSRSYPAR